MLAALSTKLVDPKEATLHVTTPKLILLLFVLSPFSIHAQSLDTRALQESNDRIAPQESNQQDAAALIESIEKRDLASVERWLAAGVSANAENQGGSPALILAIKTGHTGIINALLDGGADANADYKSWTALGLAAHNGRLDIVKLLINRGARINAEGDCHHTALGLTAEGAMHKSLTEFVRQRITPPEQDSSLTDDDPGDIRDFGGEHLQIAELLIAKGADVNALSDCETGDWTATALVIASISGNVELVKLLLAHNADPNRKTAATPLMLLTTENELMSAEEIGEHDSPEEKQQKQVMNEWRRSLKPAHAQIAELLKQAGARDSSATENEDSGSGNLFNPIGR